MTSLTYSNKGRQAPTVVVQQGSAAIQITRDYFTGTVRVDALVSARKCALVTPCGYRLA